MYKNQRKEGVRIDLKPSKLELSFNLFLYIDYTVRLKNGCSEDYLIFSKTRPWQSLLNKVNLNLTLTQQFYKNPKYLINHVR